MVKKRSDIIFLSGIFIGLILFRLFGDKNLYIDILAISAIMSHFLIYGLLPVILNKNKG